MIPGWLIALFTFPGIIVHEISHRFLAELFKVPVYDICYFRVSMCKNKSSGYVLIGAVEKTWHAFLICIGPFLINSILCIIITSPAIIYMHVLGEKNFILSGCMVWLGISIGAHAIPSNEDIASFMDIFYNSKHNFVSRLFIEAIVLLFRLSNALKFFWLDFIYAVAISRIVPYLLGFGWW